METHSGNSAKKEPVDRRWPLQEVAFIGPTKIPGLSMHVTTLEMGVPRLMDGKEWSSPPLWYDPVNRLVLVEGAAYPLERVHYFRRAKTAFAKKAPKLNLDQYRIGKRNA